MGNIISRPIFLSVALFYPLYASFRSLEQYELLIDEKDDISTHDLQRYHHKQWLSYWMVYGAYRIVTFFLDPFISVIPMYSIWKLVFLFWLQNPKSRGAIMIYDNYLGPWMKKNRILFEKLGILLAKKSAETGFKLSSVIVQRIKSMSYLLKKTEQ